MLQHNIQRGYTAKMLLGPHNFDIAPRDIYFPPSPIMRDLRGKRFDSVTVIQTAFDRVLDSVSVEKYQEVYQVRKPRW